MCFLSFSSINSNQYTIALTKCWCRAVELTFILIGTGVPSVFAGIAECSKFSRLLRRVSRPRRQVNYSLIPSFELRDVEVRYRRPSIEYINAADDGLQRGASQLRQQASSTFLLVRLKSSSPEQVSNTSWLVFRIAWYLHR